MDWINRTPTCAEQVIQIAFHEKGVFYIAVENNFNNPDFTSILKYLGFKLNKKGDLYIIQPDKSYENFTTLYRTYVYNKIMAMPEENIRLVEGILGYFTGPYRNKIAKSVSNQHFDVARQILDIVYF